MARLFPFVQFEFSHAVGPAAGNYLVDEPDPDGGVLDELDPADDEAGDLAELHPDAPPALGSADVLVVRIIGATAMLRRISRRRARNVEAGDPPREVPITQMTVIRGTRMFDAESSARTFLKAMRASALERERWVADALAVVNRSIIAHRACAADPYVIEVTRADPREVRVGFGRAEELALGQWQEALHVPDPPPARMERAVRLMPTQATARVMAGRATTLESELLLLRVLLDLEHGRSRAAALGLQVAWELLQHELAGQLLAGPVRRELEKAQEATLKLGDIAARARAGTPTDDDGATLLAAAEQMGVVVDRWRHQPLA